MTRASHHHPNCHAIRSTDDNCNCSWLISPELPLEQRYILSPVVMRPDGTHIPTEMSSTKRPDGSILYTASWVE